MTITVFGATGQVGKRVVAQGLAMGHHIRAFGRNVAALIDKELYDNHFKAVKGYVFDEAEVLHVVKDADAVISVLGGAFDGSDKTRSLGIKNIITQMKKAGVQRIIALGGMGILNAADGRLLIEQPEYPEQYKPVGMEHLQAYRFLQQSGLHWTFVCSPDILDQDGSQQYITHANYPPSPNHYKIAAGDLAHFMLGTITSNEYLHQRVGISRL